MSAGPDLKSLIAYGYFPKELPSPFRTVSLARVLESLPTDLGNDRTQPTRFNLARAGGFRRPLAIPNPRSQISVARLVADHWSEFSAHYAKSAVSLTRPVPETAPRPGKRAIHSRHDFDERPQVRADRMSCARYTLYGDVSQCYSSIYTHSIEWALDGKEASKSRLKTRGPTRSLGALLDMAVQHGQWGQTKGIPIGPDTSHAIAELILCAIDAEIQAHHPDLGDFALRFMDDLEVFAKSRQQADAILLAWESELAQYELEINPLKTRILERPRGVDSEWRRQIEQFRFDTSTDADLADQVRLYFGLVFELAERFPHESVVAYSISRCSRGNTFGDESWKAFVQLLLPAAIAEPSALKVISFALEAGRRAGRAIPEEALARTLNDVILHHAPLAHGSEVTWALWILATGPTSLDLEAANVVAAMTDNTARVVLLYLSQLGRIDGDPDLSSLEAATQEDDSLVGPNWLLAYESARKGWHSDAIVKADRYFAALLDAGVSFFEPPVARRPPRRDTKSATDAEEEKGADGEVIPEPALGNEREVRPDDAGSLEQITVPRTQRQPGEPDDSADIEEPDLEEYVTFEDLEEDGGYQ